MDYSRQFEQYLESFRSRLGKLLVARGVAVLAVAALASSLVAVAAAVRMGFPDSFMLMARLVIAAGLAALGYNFFVIRMRRTRQQAAAEIERRAPAFGGRVEAYLDSGDPRNPMRELLAEESMRLAAANPPGRQVPAREFRTAWSAAGAALAVLLLIAIAGPGNYSYGVRDLWVGWAFPGLLPPQSIEVTPGDDGIRLGGTVRVRAAMQGFDPADAFVHASFGDGDWQQVPMSETDDGFEFTFFSVRQPLEYFVSANNVRSPSYNVRVVDLPVVENLALTYHYPEWTGREPDMHDPGGDIRAIAATEVELTITTDRPMTPGAVIIDDDGVALNVDGNAGTARFALQEDGQYYVAATVGGERIRLTDDFFITILDDRAPEIEFARPGRDWSASRIEEVTARVRAEDDFRVDAVELRYSVNGGEWRSVPLDAAAGEAVRAEHVFFLESLGGADDAPLAPGDLVSYYAVATDREQTASTDMFFIDVQPFDRRYSQSQQSGGAGPQGGPGDEVSQRQREIIISTWNLIRERNEQGRGDDAFILDNAALLAQLQETLRGQVETLAQRSEARQLTASDEDIAEFVDHLRKAAEAMTPAAALLAEIDLEEALLPEQEALQHLLAAEAVFNDINVSRQSGRGGGGQAGRDLTEMFELEMDLEKNQYETGSTASPNAPEEEMQDAADVLEELARRQEQLARNQDRAGTPTPEQRWQQEMLRRELEDLQDRLEQMSASNQQSQQQSQSSQGQGQQQGEPSQAGERSERELDELQRRVQSALRAMSEADDAMRNVGDPESLQRAMGEAQRQLEGARDQAADARQRALQDALETLADRADELLDTQAGLERTLQRAVRETMENPDADNPLDSGLSWQEELELAEDKRELLAELQRLQQDAQSAARTYDEDDPQAADEIREGIDRIRDMEVEARIAVAAAYIEQGEAVYVASSESAVTEALRRLRDDLQRASAMAAAGDQPREDDGVRATLAEARELRRALQQAASAAPGRETGTRTSDLEAGSALREQAQDVSQDVLDQLRQIAGTGVDPQDVDELRRLAAEVRASDFSGNPDVLAREARQALGLVEQLELALVEVVVDEAPGIRSDANEDIAEQHRDIVADYYRRLGQAGEDQGD